MAAIEENGIHYFFHPTTPPGILEKIKCLYGSDGVYMYYLVLEEIYGEEGYFMIWNKDKAQIFDTKVLGDMEKTPIATDVVLLCVEEGFFNKKLFEKHSVLTSHWIQLHWSQSVAISMRKRIKKKYRLESVKKATPNQL